MIQQMLPPQKPLLLHINITSKNFSAAVCRSFQDIPAKEFGAKKYRRGIPLRYGMYLDYPHRPSGYLPSAESARSAAMTVGLSAA